MKDRIGIRNHVQDALAWEDPDLFSERSSFFRSSSQSMVGVGVQDPDKAPLCRALRGFVACKQS